jgi:hypothetical protein
MSFTRTATGAGSSKSSVASIATAAFTSVAGRPIVGYVAFEGADTTVLILDTAGNTYVVGTKTAHTNGDQHIAPFYCLSSLGHASNIVTCDFGASRGYCGIQAAEYSLTGTAEYDGQAYGEGAGVTAATTGSIATTGAAGLLFAGAKAYNNTTITAGGSLTLITQENDYLGDADQILSASGSYTATMNSSASTALSVVAIALKEAASGPTVTSVTQTSGGTEGSPAVMTVSLSGATSGSTNFAATLAGVTATGSGTDFTSDLASATYSNGVTFSGGNMVVPDAVSGWTVTISTTSDTLDEANETATLTVGGTAGTLTITDDDAAPTITGTASSTVTAGDPVVITYSPGLSGQTRTYTLALTDGTAVGGTDYDNTTVTGDFAVTAGTGSVSISGGTVTVDAGVTEFTLTIGTIA